MVQILRNDTARIEESLPGIGECDAVFLPVRRILDLIPFEASGVHMGIVPYLRMVSQPITGEWIVAPGLLYAGEPDLP
jgi:hypothetical protein